MQVNTRFKVSVFYQLLSIYLQPEQIRGMVLVPETSAYLPLLVIFRYVIDITIIYFVLMLYTSKSI